MTERMLPHDLEAEASVLGALMLESGAITRVADLLRPHDFYLDQNAQVYRACLNLFERAGVIDLTTVTAELKTMNVLERLGGVIFVAELQGAVPTAANAEHYARLVKDASTKRALIREGTKIVALGFDVTVQAEQAVDRAQGALFDVADGRSDHGFVALKDILPGVWDGIEKAHLDRASVSGVASGFLDLDRKLGGLQPANVIILAGRPGTGKTSLVLNIAEYVAVERGQPVGIFSLEMSRSELGTRLVAGKATVDAYQLRVGALSDAEWARIASATGVLAEAPVYIDDSPMLSVMDIRAKARRLKVTHGLALLVVDYLQLVQGRTQESREREVADVSRSLKGLARELNVPIIGCAQLNRESEKRADHRPQLSDLRDSGAIEMDADLVLFLYRHKLYSGTAEAPDIAELIIAKHRNGPTGTVELLFCASQTRFQNYERKRAAPAVPAWIGTGGRDGE